MKNVPVRDKKEAQEDPDVRAVIAEVETDLGEPIKCFLVRGGIPRTGC